MLKMHFAFVKLLCSGLIIRQMVNVAIAGMSSWYKYLSTDSACQYRYSWYSKKYFERSTIFFMLFSLSKLKNNIFYNKIIGNGSGIEKTQIGPKKGRKYWFHKQFQPIDSICIVHMRARSPSPIFMYKQSWHTANCKFNKRSLI